MKKGRLHDGGENKLKKGIWTPSTTEIRRRDIIDLLAGVAGIIILTCFLYILPSIDKPSHLLVDFVVFGAWDALMITMCVLSIHELILKKKGHVREKVYITHCPYCGYEFKYGVAKYCPNCHHRIWRPYKWVWVKKEKVEEEDGENLKIEGGDR